MSLVAGLEAKVDGEGGNREMSALPHLVNTGGVPSGTLRGPIAQGLFEAAFPTEGGEISV